MGKTSIDHFEPDRLHRITKALAVLGFIDRVLRCPDHLNTELLQHPVTHQIQGTVQASLAPHRGQQYIRALFFNNQRDSFPGDRFNIGGIRELGIGHDRGGIGIHQNDPVALFAKRLAGLHTGVVKFARLPDYDRARANHQHRGDVSSLRHVGCLWLLPSGQQTDQKG